MKFKTGDKVKMKDCAKWNEPHFGTSKDMFNTLKTMNELTIRENKLADMGGDLWNIIQLKEKIDDYWEFWNFPERWFELVSESIIKVGDYVNIKKPSDKWLKKNGYFGLTEANWTKAEQGNPHLIISENSNAWRVNKICKSFYIKFGTTINYYFPVTSMTKVDKQKKNKDVKTIDIKPLTIDQMKMDASLNQIADFKLGQNVTHLLEHDICYGKVETVKHVSIHNWVTTSSSSTRLHSPKHLYIHKKSEQKMKFKFKVGDKVKFKNTKSIKDDSNWYGKIVEIDKTRKNGKIHTPYLVYWTIGDGVQISKRSTTFYNKNNLVLSISPPVISKRKEKEMSTFIGRKNFLAKKKVLKKMAIKKTSGYVVRALIKNSTAATAGICVGDTITNVAGNKIAARGSLGVVLRGFKKGAKVSITVIKPDGRVVHVHSVTMKANKAGRATLGVISGKKKAAAYNTKLDSAKLKLAKSTKKTINEVLEPTNEFEKRAAEEMKAVAALMADMKGRDALMKAKKLRSDLHSELKKGTFRSADDVNLYINKLRDESADELEPKPKRKLSRLGKFIFGLAGVGVLSGIASAIAYGITLL